MSWRHQTPKHETRNILLNNLGSKQSGKEIWPVYVILQNKFFFKKYYEKLGPETSSWPFSIIKESFVKRNLRRSVSWFGQILKALRI